LTNFKRNIDDSDVAYFLREPGHSIRDATYKLLASEMELSLNDALIYLCKITGRDQADSYSVAYTSLSVERAAGLELYKIYKEDPAKTHLAKYARHAIDAAFDL